MIKESIFTGIRQPNLYDLNELQVSLKDPGMPEFNLSQAQAISDGCCQRMTLIQGPPGTGKTRVLAAVVANMIFQKPGEQVLVVTSMNFTADLVAEELYKLKMI